MGDRRWSMKNIKKRFKESIDLKRIFKEIGIIPTYATESYAIISSSGKSGIDNIKALQNAFKKLGFKTTVIGSIKANEPQIYKKGGVEIMLSYNTDRTKLIIELL